MAGDAGLDDGLGFRGGGRRRDRVRTSTATMMAMEANDGDGYKG